MVMNSEKTKEELLKEAEAMLETPECEEGVKQIMQLAEGGYAPAQTNLGILYLDGNHVAQSDETAVCWFKRAAEQGDEQAQRNLESLGEG